MGGSVSDGAGRPQPVDLPGGRRGLVLESPQVRVTLLPDQGCDVHELVDRRTGVDVLWKPPWGVPPPGAGRWNAEDEPEWLERYPGGWQVLCPNGGAASRAPGGALWGFHGEASRIPWRIEASDAGDGAPWARLSTRLTRSPLALTREVRLAGSVLRVTESVTNTGPDPIGIMWSHHPAFGAPLVGEGAVLATGARTFLADEVAPGTHLAAGSRHPWPHARTADGGTRDLSVLPGPADRVATFGYLTDFAEPWFAITNPGLGLGVGMCWDPQAFGHTWLWQEMHASPGHPWWREAYVCAVEPATTIPGHGVAGAPPEALRWLDGGRTASAWLEAVVFEPSGQVHAVRPGGEVA